MDKRISFALIVAFVMLLSVCTFTFKPVTAQFFNGAIIDTDGFVTGTNNIQCDGDIYTLTGNIFGGIQIQKSGVILDGAGFSLIGDGAGRGLDFSAPSSESSSTSSTSNVTVRNIKIVNFTYGIYIATSAHNVFYSNHVSNCEVGFWITGDSNNDVLYNTIQDNIDGVSLNYATGINTISHNNVINSGFLVWQSTSPHVDRNYWSDYQTKYSNATEIGNSGVGDVPYIYNEGLNSLSDNHPLIKPISTSDIQLPLLTPPPSPTFTPYRPPGTLPIGTPIDQILIGSLLAGAAFIIVALAIVAVLVLRKRRKF